MITKIFTVYDSKAKSYLSPFYMQTTGQAVRAFEDTCNDPSTQFNKHPNDFTLFEIGAFDDQTCQIETMESKIHLGSANEMINETQQQMVDQNINSTLEAVK